MLMCSNFHLTISYISCSTLLGKSHAQISQLLLLLSQRATSQSPYNCSAFTLNGRGAEGGVASKLIRRKTNFQLFIIWHNGLNAVLGVCVNCIFIIIFLLMDILRSSKNSFKKLQDVFSSFHKNLSYFTAMNMKLNSKSQSDSWVHKNYNSIANRTPEPAPMQRNWMADGWLAGWMITSRYTQQTELSETI